MADASGPGAEPRNEAGASAEASPKSNSNEPDVAIDVAITGDEETFTRPNPPDHGSPLALQALGSKSELDAQTSMSEPVAGKTNGVSSECTRSGSPADVPADTPSSGCDDKAPDAVVPPEAVPPTAPSLPPPTPEAPVVAPPPLESIKRELTPSPSEYHQRSKSHQSSFFGEERRDCVSSYHTPEVGGFRHDAKLTTGLSNLSKASCPDSPKRARRPSVHSVASSNGSSTLNKFRTMGTFRDSDVAMMRESRHQRLPSRILTATDLGRDSDEKSPPAAESIMELLEKERRRLSRQVSSRAYENDHTTLALEGSLLRAGSGKEAKSSNSSNKQFSKIIPVDQGPSMIEAAAAEVDPEEIAAKYMGLVTPMKWVLTWLSAIAIALEAAGIILGSHDLIYWKLILLDEIVRTHGLTLAFLFSFFCAWLAAIIAAILVTYVATHAGGGGIPEVIAHLNGIEMPQAFTPKVWFARSFGLFLVNSAGIFAGPEGPFVHIGSLVSVGILSGPKWKGRALWPSVLKGHRNRCEFIAQGAAMGVSAAFGAPVGGVLFALEEAATYWSHALMWRVLVGSTLAALVAKWAKSGFSELKSSDGFIEFPDSDASFAPWELLSFAFLGLLTGFLGASFNRFAGILNRARRRIFSLADPTRASRRNRILEVTLVVLLTHAVCFWLPVLVGCTEFPSSYWSQVSGSQSQSSSFDRRLAAIALEGGICPEGTYSEMYIMLMQPKDAVVKGLFGRSFGHGAAMSIPGLLGCFAVAYCLTSLTFGSAIPCGLFIPHILSGACLGRALGESLNLLGFEVHPGVYALMGSTGMLSGFSRMTISLVAIMMEITNSTRLLVPIIVVVLMSKVVADRISPGINHVVLGLNPSVHLLEDDISEDRLMILDGLVVHDACTADVVALSECETLENIMSILVQSTFAGYPIVDNRHRLLGLVNRAQLVSVLTDPRAQQEGKVAPLRLTTVAPEITLWNTPLARAFRHFKTAGLQHLCVVDEYNRLLGILTRTDFSRLCHHGKAGTEEVRNILTRKQAAIAAGRTSFHPRAEDSDSSVGG
eukprot:TRINITY_DN16560_c0_g4_i1.p1 TRINITY_DN16560_c0_g4~~TRINITY_DN16560_c0_g4_i1.p1  ORF type:complete len:1051 (-),score=101.39 TRINITY_DN16560_c0_g4_i1:120-3272(-)